MRMAEVSRFLYPMKGFSQNCVLEKISSRVKRNASRWLAPTRQRDATRTENFNRFDVVVSTHTLERRKRTLSSCTVLVGKAPLPATPPTPPALAVTPLCPFWSFMFGSRQWTICEARNSWLRIHHHHAGAVSGHADQGAGDARDSRSAEG